MDARKIVNERNGTATQNNKEDGMSDKAETAVMQRSPLIGLANKYNVEPSKLLTVLKTTVFKPHRDGKQATDEEVAALCIVAQQYNLNPWLRELYAFPDSKGGIVPLVPIDGWTKIVNSRDDFNGCEFDEVSDADGKPVSITCRMYVKGREHPVSVTERYDECKRNTAPWSTMPWRMLRHKAYMQAARYAFGLAGIYDEDEAHDIVNVTPSVTVSSPKPLKKAAPQAKVEEPVVESVVEPPPEPEPPEQPDEPAGGDAPLTMPESELIALLEKVQDDKPVFFKKGCKAHDIDLKEWRKAGSEKLQELLDSVG